MQEITILYVMSGQNQLFKQVINDCNGLLMTVIKKYFLYIFHELVL